MGIRTFIGIKQRQGLQETCLHTKGIRYFHRNTYLLNQRQETLLN
jgi:hypothetical protein